MIVFVAGTHEQPMARLVPVLARIARGQPDRGPFVAQHGAAALPEGWSGAALYDRVELGRLLAAADLVITHGGPATIAESRARGRIPVVVPRQSAFGEHVDDHQLAYSRRLAAAGEIVLVTEVDALPQVVADYETLIRYLPQPQAHDPLPAVEAFAVLAERIVDG